MSFINRSMKMKYAITVVALFFASPVLAGTVDPMTMTKPGHEKDVFPLPPQPAPQNRTALNPSDYPPGSKNTPIDPPVQGTVK